MLIPLRRPQAFDCLNDASAAIRRLLLVGVKFVLETADACREKMPEPNYSPDSITVKHYRNMADL